MSIAATEAGIAFNNASVTIVHGMSRPIGALFHIAHGVSNAILLPACMKFAIEENTARFATIARTMGVADDATPDHDAAEAFVAEVTRFCKEVGIPSHSRAAARRTRCASRRRNSSSRSTRNSSDFARIRMIE